MAEIDNCRLFLLLRVQSVITALWAHVLLFIEAVFHHHLDVLDILLFQLLLPHGIEVDIRHFFKWFDVVDASLDEVLDLLGEDLQLLLKLCPHLLLKELIPHQFSVLLLRCLNVAAAVVDDFGDRSVYAYGGTAPVAIIISRFYFLCHILSLLVFERRPVGSEARRVLTRRYHDSVDNLRHISCQFLSFFEHLLFILRYFIQELWPFVW